ncbi:MAG: hypothetical protein DMF88_05640 [Acidobacteria bacterium]|nr:MAG: hypothetical protein DMF88_05640 [Acidobacteriota bacterium]
MAVGNSYSTDEDTALVVTAAGVLDNDSDVDGNPMTAILVSGTAHGTLSLGADGGFTFTPVANYNGPDSFTYKANDGVTDSNVVTVSLTINAVNDAPVAVADSYSTNEDTPLTVAAPGLLANDSDVEGGALTAIKMANPAHGTVTVNANGSFTYVANDGSVNSATVTVTLTVNAVNDAPVAVGDSYSVTANATLTVAAPGVLTNDSDIDSPSITAALVGSPTHGTLTLNANGSFTYTPAANYSGPDSFTYRASDGLALSNVATVTITVNAVSGLVAAYSFGEGAGTTVADASGRGNNGTILNATWTAAGRYGGALLFNGTNAWITVPDNSSLSLATGMTLEAWVQPTSASSNAYRSIILKERPSGLSYSLYSNNSSRRSSTYINLGATMLRLYVNGALVTSKSVPGSLVTSGGALRIGGNSVWGEWFMGYIDEVRIYNRALSAGEIQTDMNAPIVP